MPKTVLCGGCFNVVHEGHVYFLNRARALGDKLVVVVANDAHNKKPYARPASVRARALRTLKLADRVIIGNEKSFIPTILKIKPSIVALGYDQSLPLDAAEKLDELGIKVRRIGRCKKISTAALCAAERRKNRRL